MVSRRPEADRQVPEAPDQGNRPRRTDYNSGMRNRAGQRRGRRPGQ
jgi:hypothetical protein